MIKTKEDLNAYIKADLKYYPDTTLLGEFKDKIIRNDRYYIRKYIKILRHLEYYKNNQTNIIHKICFLFLFVKWKRLSNQMGLIIPPNCCDKGLWLFHTINSRTGMVKDVKVGSRVIIRPGVVLGYQGDSMRESMNAPVVDNDVEFSWGARVFGKVHIGRGALIGTNCVVMNNIPPYAMVIGNPGKVIGFTKTPEEIVEYEKTCYPEQDRLPLEVLNNNYRKYFLSRIKDIKEYMRIH